MSDFDTADMKNLHYHAFNYRNAHSTQASNDFNTLEDFVSNLGIAAGEKWREEWSEVCNENQDLHNEIDTLRAQNQALLEALKTVLSESHDGPLHDYYRKQARAAIKLAEKEDV